MIGKPSCPVRREAARKRTKLSGWYLAARPTHPPGSPNTALPSATTNGSLTTTRPWSPGRCSLSSPAVLHTSIIRESDRSGRSRSADDPSDGDDHLAARVAPFQIPERFGGLDQWVRSVDDGSEPVGLDQLAHGLQVLLIHLRVQPAQLLTHKQGQQGRPEDPAEEAPGPWPTAVASDDHEDPLAGEGAAKL